MMNLLTSMITVLQATTELSKTLNSTGNSNAAVLVQSSVSMASRLMEDQVPAHDLPRSYNYQVAVKMAQLAEYNKGRMTDICAPMKRKTDTELIISAFEEVSKSSTVI